MSGVFTDNVFTDSADDLGGWFDSNSYKPNELFVHSKLSYDYICYSSPCIDYIKSVRLNQ